MRSTKKERGFCPLSCTPLPPFEPRVLFGTLFLPSPTTTTLGIFVFALYFPSAVLHDELFLTCSHQLQSCLPTASRSWPGSVPRTGSSWNLEASLSCLSTARILARSTYVFRRKLHWRLLFLVSMHLANIKFSHEKHKALSHSTEYSTWNADNKISSISLFAQLSTTF